MWSVLVGAAGDSEMSFLPLLPRFETLWLLLFHTEGCGHSYSKLQFRSEVENFAVFHFSFLFCD